MTSFPLIFLKQSSFPARPALMGIAMVILVAALLVPPVSAHCPLCTAGAAVGVGIARAYGVDDSIVGLFLGAFIAASGLWIDRLLRKRSIEYPFQGAILVAVSLLSVAAPLYLAGIITNVTIVKGMTGYSSILGLEALGIDKLFAGLLIGTVLIAGVFTISDGITEGRGKRLFRYQGMIFMAITLAAATILLLVTVK